MALKNCTIANNAAPNNAFAGLRCDPSTIENTVIWGNVNNGNPRGANLSVVNGVTVVRYSDIQGGKDAVGGPSWPAIDWDDDVTNTNIGELDDPPSGPTDNPLFVHDMSLPVSDRDYRIWSGSRCIDRASNVLVPQDALDVDGDNNTVEKVPLDLFGAPRFVDDPETVDTGEQDAGYPDVTDMGAFEYLLDCNENGIPDWDAQETGGDANGNGLLDECEGPPTAEAFYDPPSGGPCLQNSDCSDVLTGPGSGVDSICVLPQRVCYTPKHRHLSFNPHVAGNAAFAHRISVKNAAGGFDPVGWVSAEVAYNLMVPYTR